MKHEIYKMIAENCTLNDIEQKYGLDWWRLQDYFVTDIQNNFRNETSANTYYANRLLDNAIYNTIVDNYNSDWELTKDCATALINDNKHQLIYTQQIEQLGDYFKISETIQHEYFVSADELLCRLKDEAREQLNVVAGEEIQAEVNNRFEKHLEGVEVIQSDGEMKIKVDDNIEIVINDEEVVLKTKKEDTLYDLEP